MMIIDREKLNGYWRTHAEMVARWRLECDAREERIRAERTRTWATTWTIKYHREQLRESKQRLFQVRQEMLESPSGRQGRAHVERLALRVLEWEQAFNEDRMTEEEREWCEQWEEAGGWR